MTAFLRYAVALALLLAVAAPVPVFAFGSNDSSSSSSSSSTADLFTKAEKKVKAEQYADAIPMLEKVIKEGFEERQRAELSRLQLSQDRSPGQSIELLRASARHQSKPPRRERVLGELYLELKQLDKAQERLNVLSTACNGCEEYT